MSLYVKFLGIWDLHDTASHVLSAVFHYPRKFLPDMSRGEVTQCLLAVPLCAASHTVPHFFQDLMVIGDLVFICNLLFVLGIPVAVACYDLWLREPFHATEEGQKQLLRDRARLALPPDHHFAWNIRSRLKGDPFTAYLSWLEQRRVDVSRVMLGAMRHPLYLDDSEQLASVGRLAVAQDLYGGEVILAVPPHLLLGPHAAMKSELGKLLGPLPVHTALAVHLLHERAKGEASYWGPYVATLPEKPNSFLWWEPEQRQALRGFSVQVVSLISPPGASCLT